MEKFFQSLSKPARLIFIICGFVCTALFTIFNGASFGGTFFSVVASLIILIVGAALLVGAPLLTLFNKKEAAKVVYLILLGYWLITIVQTLFFASSGSLNNRDAVDIIIIIISFSIALALVGVLVFAALEFFFKNKAFRFIAVFLFFIAVAAMLVLYVFHLVDCIQANAGWTSYFVDIFSDIACPVALLFGYLYFFGAPSKK